MNDKPKRNSNIDIFRILAAFFVVCIHVDYGSINGNIVELIKISSRWAVPFFFIVTGIYLKEDRLLLPQNIIFKLISIHIVADIIFIIFKYINNEKIDFQLVDVLRGTYLHLWFIGSMILGIIIIWYLNRLEIKEKYLIILSLVILVFTLLTDGYGLVFGIKTKYMPFFLSIPFIYLGSRLRYLDNINRQVILLLMILSFLFQFIEYKFLLNLDSNFRGGRLFIGTIVFSFLLVLFLYNKPFKIKKIILSKLGKNYSLFIYLYHPVFVVVIITLFKDKTYIYNVMPFLVFLVTLGVGIIINKITPRLFLILNGNIKSIIK